MAGKRHPERTPEEWVNYTEIARRKARFKAAQERIQKIVDAAPPLTDEQRRELAAIIAPGTEDKASSS